MLDREQVQLPIEDIKPADIVPGTTIVGIQSGSEIATLVGFITEEMKPYLDKDYICYEGGVYYPQGDVARFIDESRPKGFHGRFGEINVVMLDPEESVLNKKIHDDREKGRYNGKYSDVDASTIVALMVNKRMISSAPRLNGVDHSIEVDLYIGHRTAGTATTERPYVMMETAVNPKAEKLAIKESRRIWHSVMARGLARAYRGGLPGLGARR